MFGLDVQIPDTVCLELLSSNDRPLETEMIKVREVIEFTHSKSARLGEEISRITIILKSLQRKQVELLAFAATYAPVFAPIRKLPPRTVTYHSSRIYTLGVPGRTIQASSGPATIDPRECLSHMEKRYSRITRNLVHYTIPSSFKSHGCRHESIASLAPAFEGSSIIH